jgi:hypothetical protein
MTRQSTLAAAAITLALLLFAGIRTWSDDAVETIVLLRHGEKPEQGLGQLNCQGLNRALALPSVIAKTFGRPSAIFAPNPSQRKDDHGGSYDYVRPLATIEPTAIFFGLPVNASFGFNDIDGVRAAIEQPGYRNAVVLVAWEHKSIEAIARALLAAHGGEAPLVPKWHKDDFDSIYVVTISGTGNAAKATFAHQHEGLDGQPDILPPLRELVRASHGVRGATHVFAVLARQGPCGSRLARNPEDLPDVRDLAYWAAFPSNAATKSLWNKPFGSRARR